jgi:LDH2 family malate/lactate/ureidoglycolate dehydrogenase
MAATGHDEGLTMIVKQLCASLDRRAEALLAAAQFASDAGQLRAAAVVAASAIVARSHGLAGVEGYLAALKHLGTSDDQPAGRSIRDAIDEAIVAVASAAWTGGLSAPEEAEPAMDMPQGLAAAA